MKKKEGDRPECSAKIPTVSVCIPTHNRKETLAGVLAMLQAQTFQDFEIVVCDDGSVDGTYEFLCGLGWPRLTILRNVPNLNYPGTMKRLFGRARGRYIAVQHDHDHIETNWLERMVALMDSHPTAGLGCCACRRVEGDGRLIEEGSAGLSKAFPLTGTLPGKALIKVLATEVHTPLAVTGSLFRREVVDQAGGYRSEWYLASDEDLYRRVALHSGAAFCSERLLVLTARPPQSTAKFGGWRAIYTIYEFRRDTALNFSPGNVVLRQLRALRLDALKYVALSKQAVRLWMRGDFEGLQDALRRDLIPPLPTKRPPLSRPGRIVLGLMIAVMSRTPRIAKWVGRTRESVRRTSAVED